MVTWNIDVTAWVASATVVTGVLAFAAKDTIGNLFAGLFIMADSPYKEGDYINLDQGERGYVRHIGIRSTRILTRDDIEITIPNSVIANSKIINESGGPYEKERIRITLDVAYGTEIDKAKKIVLAYDKAEKKGLGVVSFRNKMIDPPVVNRAQHTLNLAVSTGLVSRKWKRK